MAGWPSDDRRRRQRDGDGAEQARREQRVDGE